MMNPLVGNVSWPVPDNHCITVTLFKDPRTHELEDKDWTFVIEDVSFYFCYNISNTIFFKLLVFVIISKQLS